MDQRPYHKLVTLNIIEEKLGNIFKLMDTGSFPEQDTTKANIKKWDN